MRGAGFLPALVAAGVLAVPASAASGQQASICAAIATSNHLKVSTACPKPASPTLTFTVKVPAPAGYESTVAYTIIDSEPDAQAAWAEEDTIGPETTLPAAGRVPKFADPSYLYSAPGDDEAEATALVGTVIVDMVLVPTTSSGRGVPLKPRIEALLGNATAVVRSDEAHARA